MEDGSSKHQFAHDLSQFAMLATISVDENEVGAPDQGCIFFGVWPPSAAMLGNSVVVVVVRKRPRAIPLAMITMRKSTHGFPVLSRDKYGAPLGGPSGRRSSAITMRKLTHGFPFLSHDAYRAPLGGPSGRRSSAITSH